MTVSSRVFGVQKWFLAIVALSAMAIPAMAQDKPESKLPEKPAAKGDEKAEPAEKSDPFLVPQGTAEELLKYIDRLTHERPTGGTREAVSEFRKKLSTALLTAAERILSGKPDAEQTSAAARYKVIALSIAEQIGDTEAGKKLVGYLAELEKSGNHKELVRELKAFLLEGRLRRARGMAKDEVAKLLDEVSQWLAAGPVDETAAELAMGAGMAAEQIADAETAAKAYANFAKILSGSKEKPIAAMAAMMEGAGRRVVLLGKPMNIEGTTMDGKPFDWKAYKGKVVLVDFWATWCPPCRAEIPNIEKNYEAYHDRGFDVVSISVDQDRAALEEFLAKHKHPWTVLHDNHDARGTDKSMSTYYGVFGVPTAILVAGDGKVISLNARGPELVKQLAKLLGPAEKKEEKKEEKK